jgi:hypothetical protein
MARAKIMSALKFCGPTLRHQASGKSARRIALRLLGLSAALAIWVAPAAAIAPYSMKPAALQPSPDLPQKIADSLDPNGLHVFTYDNGLETPICEIFLATTVVGQDRSANSSKILYGNLKEGALVGVIRFLAESKDDYREDFHDQKLPAGYYTMRYHAMQDGEKNDFVLLSSVKLDRDPNRVVASDELLSLSRQASGSDQPAVLSLVAVDKNSKDFPEVLMADDGSCVLEVKLHLKPVQGLSAKELDFAIIVATPPDEDGGS